MAEADYEHECLRAELLGLPKPDINEFRSRQKENTAEGNEEETPADEVDEGVRREELHRIGGGLEELNTILSSTQRKLNRLKTVFGNFGNLLKGQIGGGKEGNEKTVGAEGDACSEEDQGQERGKEAGTGVVGLAALPVKREGNAELDKLDSLISRAEKAELSLSSQNKQIKKYLN